MTKIKSFYVHYEEIEATINKWLEKKPNITLDKLLVNPIYHRDYGPTIHVLIVYSEINPSGYVFVRRNYDGTNTTTPNPFSTTEKDRLTAKELGG